MPLNPQESRKAHPQTQQPVCVAASISKPLASSPAPGMRDPTQPASRRGGDAGQTSPRHVGPIPPRILHQIFDEDMALNRRRAPATDEPPSWGQIAFAAVCAFAFVLFILALDGGSFS